MEKRLITRALLTQTVAVAASPPEARAQSRVTLQQVVAEALAKNDRILDDADASPHAELDLRLARNEFRPTVVPNGFGSFGQTDLASQHYRVDVTQRLTTGTEQTGPSSAPYTKCAISGAVEMGAPGTALTVALFQPFCSHPIFAPLAAYDYRPNVAVGGQTLHGTRTAPNGMTAQVQFRRQ
jgi:hypothetical protein